MFRHAVSNFICLLSVLCSVVHRKGTDYLSASHPYKFRDTVHTLKVVSHIAMRVIKQHQCLATEDWKATWANLILQVVIAVDWPAWMLFNIRFDRFGGGTEKRAFECYEWLKACWPVRHSNRWWHLINHFINAVKWGKCVKCEYLTLWKLSFI